MMGRKLLNLQKYDWSDEILFGSTQFNGAYLNFNKYENRAGAEEMC